MAGVLMKCGCRGNALHNGKPACVIHAPFAEAYEVAEVQPDLTGRKARCFYSDRGKNIHAVVDSSLDLAFFEYKPDEEYDWYYCGCHGWD